VKIGELAALAGVRASAIRWYERQGLLEEPPRESGRRVYGRRAIQQLQRIAMGQAAGLSLEEIRMLLAGLEGGPVSPKWREHATRVLPRLRASITRLQHLEALLTSRLQEVEQEPRSGPRVPRSEAPGWRTW
jgi:DNA-binding transcriptional MerR regulator